MEGSKKAKTIYNYHALYTNIILTILNIKQVMNLKNF